MSSKKSSLTLKPCLPQDKNTSPPKLGSDFATLLLEKELEIDNNPSPQLINECVELYTQAIEFYEYKKDSKYLDFQERMHKMLVKPHILAAMSGTKRTTHSASPTIHSTDRLKTRKLETERSKKALEVEFSRSSPELQTNKNSVRMLKRHKARTDEVVNRTKNDFSSQDSALQKRLEGRKAKNLSKTIALESAPDISMDRSQLFECNLSDIGEESPPQLSFSQFDMIPESNLETFEKDLEEIMEQSFEERSKKVTEIKVKYETQFKDLESQGEFGKMIIDQMKQQMQQEIDKLFEELDQKRKQQIRLLKEQYK